MNTTMSSLTVDDLVEGENNSNSPTSTNNETEEVPEVPKSNGGHPKQTTAAYSADLQEHLVLTKNEAANEYNQVRTLTKKQFKTAPRGLLKSIVKKERAKYDVPEEAQISVETIQTCAKRESCKVTHHGLTSLMAEVENYIIKIASQMAKM